MLKAKVIHLFHILVPHRHEADDLLRLIKEGHSFFELAKKFSHCASGKNSGDLGEVNFRSLDEDFLEAAESLAIGEMTLNPVRTKFGYHLILKMQKKKS